MKTKYTKDSLIAFEDRVAQEFKDGKINCPVHLSGGNEDMLLSIFNTVNERDYVLSTHRNHYHYLLKGGDPEKLMAELRGEEGGCCGGKGRSMHIYDKSINFLTSAIVGGICSIGVGIALGVKKKYKGKKDRPMVWVFVGDGCEDSGFFVEAVRFGVSRDLPITFVIEDNDRAVEATKADRWHNHSQITSKNIIRYNYVSTKGHVGVGEFVSF